MATKKKPNPRIRAEKANPRIRAKRDNPSQSTKQSAEVMTGRVDLLCGLVDQLAEARWQRKFAYDTGRLGVRYLRGERVDGGFRNNADDEIRRLYCTMWVTSLHQLHILILGLPPDPDATELEFPIKIPDKPPRERA
jgi:hypothetical protein